MPDVTLKLFASLTDYLPKHAQDNKAQIEVSDSDTVGAIIKRYNLPEKLVHLVLVNGVFITPEDRPNRVLKEGEVLAIWPPVAGG